tara:strand:+ start:532 stop:1164 length:633 start_codon:yes stop_codon:yes gene_type:complete
MKKLSLLLILFIIPSAFAVSGAGLKYNFEYVELIEKETHCLNYGIYNPYDSDSLISLTAEGEFEDFQIESEPTNVPANTNANNELRKDICFKIPKVVDSCEDGKLLKGQVIASTVPSSEGIGTALAVSAPLEMKVNCNESSFNVLFFVVPFVLISTLFGIIQIMRYSKNRKYNKLYSELMYLQKIISSGNFNQSHVDRFNKIRSILINFK